MSNLNGTLLIRRCPGLLQACRVRLEGRTVVGPEGGAGQVQVPEQLHTQLEGGEHESESVRRQRGFHFDLYRKVVQTF